MDMVRNSYLCSEQLPPRLSRCSSILQSKLEPANPFKLILTSLHQSKKWRNEKKAPLALEKEAPTNREKEPVTVVKTYLVKTGEDWRDAVVVG